MYSKYTGVILKNFPLGEADELLTIYTREGGKLRVLARGVRRAKSRLGGVLQPLNETELETAVSGRRLGGLPVVTAARTRTMNGYLRENLKKFAFALVGAETLYRLTPDGEPQEQAYDALLDFLRLLQESPDEAREVRGVQLRLLQVFGFAPRERKEIGEAELNELLNNVLEREIRSKKLLNFL